MSGRVTVEVWFDFICPWCLIGKRQLETALAAFAEEAPGVAEAVAWRPYILRPQTPAGGEPYGAFYENRLGGAAAVAARREQVRDAGRYAGVEFAFERIETLPNTFDAHELVDHTRRTAGETVAEALIERLFAAFFQEGQDIGDEGVLTRAATAVGADPQGWLAARDTHLSLARITDWARAAERARVSGVPFYLFNGRAALAGVETPAALLAALRKAYTP